MTWIRDVIEAKTVPTFSTLVEHLKRSSINPEVYVTRPRRTSMMRGHQAVLLLQLALFCVASGSVRTQGTRNVYQYLY